MELLIIMENIKNTESIEQANYSYEVPQLIRCISSNEVAGFDDVQDNSLMDNQNQPSSHQSVHDMSTIVSIQLVNFLLINKLWLLILSSQGCETYKSAFDNRENAFELKIRKKEKNISLKFYEKTYKCAF